MSAVEVRRTAEGAWRVLIDGQKVQWVKRVHFQPADQNGNHTVTLEFYPTEFRVAHDPDGEAVRYDDKPGLGFEASA